MLRHYYFVFAFLCLIHYSSIAQVVTTDPAFPTETDAVTLIFDASQGTAGLKDCNCTVYIHTGVITNESTAPSDWKYVAMQWGVENPDWALTRVEGEDNLYTFEITPSIREYYGVGANEMVEQLAFVFRNGDGSLEGKDVGGSDIFYTVYDGEIAFTSSLQSPSQTSLIKEIGETIEVRAIASQDATLTLTDNGEEIFSTTGTSLSYDLTATTAGTHEVVFTADDGEETQTASFTYVVPTEVNAIDPPADYDDGITVLGDTAIYLQLFAPGKDYAFVVGNFTDWQLSTDFQMNTSLDGNTHWILIENIEAGDYMFQYLVEGDVKTADPYSELVLDPNNDPFISEETFPNLPPYPADQASGILSWIRVGNPDYEWQVNDFTAPDREKLVVYELLVRDFVEAHNYQTLIDTLDYLENLGINAIELMPVNEFEGNISWGYNPSFHMALDKYYGTPEVFKAFIDECHRRGIAVIVDVVYNHGFSQSPFFQLYNQGGKPSPESPFMNVDATHPFNVGYDFNHESPATKKFVKKVMRYWLEEFRLDGFRFDLSKGFTQVNNPDNVGAWGNYDASRIAILKDYMDTVWEVNPNAYNIMEHFAANQEETELVEYGAMFWG
ncbi:MAG: alpha-amylase family glycosyl hydrolase, partial [Saprospiraceae bacterium]